MRRRFSLKRTPYILLFAQEIIGVTQDFHFESLHQQMSAIAMVLNPHNYRALTLQC